MTLDINLLMKAIDWAYDMAIRGGPGIDSAEALAASYAKRGGSQLEQTTALIRWQVAKAGTSGFVTGLGGGLLLPVAVPTNLASVSFVQLRMIAAVATIGGHNARDDQVRTLAYACLCGTRALDVVKKMGVTIAGKVGQRAVQRISAESLRRINQQVGFRLLTKFGEHGVVNMGKAIPILGGVVGGAFDTATTRSVGRVAQRMFVEAA